MEEEKPITRACRIVGGASQLARSLRVSPPSVSQWISGRRQVPAERCPAIERATGGAVTCEELRPDVDWAYLRGTRCEGKVSPATTAQPEKEAA